MSLINTLNSYPNTDDIARILRNIHKTYSANELRFVLSMPKYREIYNKIKTDARQSQGINVLPRNTNKFKTGLTKLYNSCPITNTNPKLCEFAHIVPYALCDSYEQDDPCNGIRLDMRIHRLWDACDNWLELHPLAENNILSAVFKIPTMHKDNIDVNNTVSEFINKPIHNICPETFRYIERRLELDTIYY